MTSKSSGLSEAIKAILLEGVSLTVPALHQRLPEYTVRQIIQSLQYLMARAGGVEAVGHRQHRKYRLPRPTLSSRLPGFTPLNRDPFYAWRLCMRAPFQGAI